MVVHWIVLLCGVVAGQEDLITKKVLADWKNNFEMVNKGCFSGNLEIGSDEKEENKLKNDTKKEYKFFSNGKFKMISGNNVNTGVGVINPSYSFFLMKPDGVGEWKMVEFYQDENHEKKSQISRSFRRYFFPGYSFGENHVFELFENKLLFLEFKKKQGSISVFDIEIVIDRPKNIVFQGEIQVDDLDNSRIVECLGSIEEQGVKINIKIDKKQIDNNTAFFEIKLKTTNYNVDGAPKSISVSTVEIKDCVPIPEEQFFLSFYGFSEPSGMTKNQYGVNKYLLISVIIVVVLFTLFSILKWANYVS